jgi:hypothetical protein
MQRMSECATFSAARTLSQIGRSCGAAVCVLVGAGCGSSHKATDGSVTNESVCAPTVVAGSPSASARYTAATIIDPTKAASLCVALQACFPLEFPKVWMSFSDCVNGGGLTSPSFPLPGDFTAAPLVQRRAIDPAVVDFYACVLGAGNDCTKIAACLLLDSAVDTCPGATGQGLRRGTCNGPLLHGCTADGYPFSVDCARYDAVCVGNEQSCGWADCPGNISPCDGPRQVQCTSSGKTVVVGDCSSEGADFQCNPSNNGPVCVTNTPCSKECDDSFWCSGSVTQFCFAGQLQYREDCARYSRFTRCTMGRTIGCVATGNECDTSVALSCLGAKVVYCDDGFTKTADCSPFGTCSNGRCVRM